MDIEEIIKRIVDNGKIEDMETLSDMLEDTMEIIKDYDQECFDKFERKLYEMAYGRKLSKQMAKEIVEKMRPYGMHWTLEETKRMQEERGINDIPSTDFFVVINSAYNDYNDLFRDNIEDYVRFTIDFINDEDAKEDKVYSYFTQIPL